jgi:hypothetical protein
VVLGFFLRGILVNFRLGIMAVGTLSFVSLFSFWKCSRVGRVGLVSPYEGVRAAYGLSEIAQHYAPSLYLVVEGVNSCSAILQPQRAAVLRPY